MPSNTRVSTASGVPAHLRAATVQGVEGGYPHLPPPVQSQHPSGVQGVGLPVDPLLAQAGAYWNAERQLVRRAAVAVGEPVEIDGRKRQRVQVSERFVAMPGASIDDARQRGLDFYSPAMGWIRAGVKREQEYAENLGTGGTPTDLEYVDVPDGADAASEVA
jgi:hypothetical protein